MRIIIAGSRDFNDYRLLHDKCHEIFDELSKEGLLSGNMKKDIPNMEIVSGTARGADQLGEKFGKEYGIKIKRMAAEWDRYGRSAGYKRNEQMALYAKEDDGVLIAYWNGSKGTKHMIDLANKHGLKVFVVEF